MNNFFLYAFFLLLFANMPNGANGQHKNDTTYIDNLDHLWQLSIENNSNQRVSALQQEQLLANYKTANSFYYPQTSGSFTGQDNLKLSSTAVPGALIGQPGKTVLLQFGKKYVYNTGFTVSQTVFDWQQVLLARIAKKNEALNDLQKSAAAQTLKIQSAQYYYALMVANASKSISVRDSLMADSIVQITEQRYKQGLVDSMTMNLAIINKNNVEQNILQSTILIKQAIANMRILASMGTNKVFIFKEVLNMDAETLSENSQLIKMGEDKTLLPYQKASELADLQIKAQKAATYPKLSLTGYWGYQQFKDDLTFDFSKGAWSDYRYLGLNLNVPLFAGFANTNKVKSSAIQRKIDEEQLFNATQQSLLTDTLLQEQFVTYKHQAAIGKRTFKLYEQNLKLSIQKYRVGLLSADAYFKLFEDYLHAENAYLTNLSNLLMIEANFLARKM